jgi:hypothetical protein
MLQRHGCDFPFSNLLNDDGDDFEEDGDDQYAGERRTETLY